MAGRELFLDVESFDGWQRMADGTFDSFIYESLTAQGSLVGMVVWDIGAHFGYHSLGFSTLVGPSGHIWAFEPNPYNVERLKKNIEHNPELRSRISVEQLALSDVNGQVEFSFSRDVDGSCSSGSHLVAAEAPLTADAYSTFDHIAVQASSIDTMISSGLLRPAGLVKIDVEGAEHLVLRGGQQFFAAHRPIIYMEIHNILMMHHCLSFLHDLGYEVEILGEVTLSRCFIFARCPAGGGAA